MSTAAVESANAQELPSSSVFSVTVSYEDTATRDRAIHVCDSMVADLGGDLEFDFSWWKFDYLGDAKLFEMAVQSATQADMVIFSARNSGEPPGLVKVWVESWITRRDLRPSALVGLIGLADETKRTSAAWHTYLFNTARRAGMDYLPQEAGNEGQFSLESLLRRAETITPFLEEILHQSHPPTHWGINE